MCSHYDLSQDDRHSIAKEEGVHPTSYPIRTIGLDEVRLAFQSGTEELIRKTQEAVGSKRYVVKKAYFAERHIDLLCHLYAVHPNVILDAIASVESVPSSWYEECAREIVSVSIGAIFGRWDVRRFSFDADGQWSDNLGSLPRCAPARLATEV